MNVVFITMAAAYNDINVDHIVKIFKQKRNEEIANFHTKCY